MFFKSKASAGGVEAIVVGLGNPGRQYEGTRHNIGWRALDAAAESWGGKIVKSKHKALTDTVTVNGKKVLLMKPQTFMNLSGEAVREAMAFYKIPIENVIVLSDDVNLDVGRMRVRKSGSDGGQKGLRSIITLTSSDNFPRIRFGVGKKPHPDYDMGDWVLGNLSESDKKAIFDCFVTGYEGLEKLLVGDVDGAMQVCNSKK